MYESLQISLTTVQSHIKPRILYRCFGSGSGSWSNFKCHFSVCQNHQNSWKEKEAFCFKYIQYYCFDSLSPPKFQKILTKFESRIQLRGSEYEYALGYVPKKY